MNNNKKLIITHLDDTDGMGGAILGNLLTLILILN